MSFLIVTGLTKVGISSLSVWCSTDEYPDILSYTNLRQDEQIPDEVMWTLPYRRFEGSNFILV